ncbi:MAG: helix-turn-helix domain-containing protein [Clostridiales bacterium]|jgi:transcriptional regulator with XRE-family HTH domain|nr:helix-turn-helix domain-containing protein [Clostridiales bacterium]
MTKETLRQMMGENIRNERLARNLSIEELADLLELTAGFVGLIERGRRGATAYTLYKLSEIFEKPIDGILKPPSEEAVGPETESHGKRAKISSLIAGFNDAELDFLISLIKSVQALRNDKISSALPDEDDG